MVVAERSGEKKSVALNLPPPLAEALDGMVGIANGKQKWAVLSAAILLLQDAPEAVRRTVVAQVISADVGLVTFEDLIDKAKAGRLRIEAERHLPNQGRPRKP